MPDTIEITKLEYQKLIDADMLVRSLKDFNVQDWEYYQDAHDVYEENRVIVE